MPGSIGQLTSLAIILLVASHAGAADNPPADEIRVRGVVLDPQGKPAGGVNVTVAPNWALWDQEMPRNTIAQTTAGADGRFENSFHKSRASAPSLTGGTSGSDIWRQAHIVASDGGSGMAWCQWDHTDANGDVVLRMTMDDVPIEGRILDDQGQGIAGASVLVDFVGPADPPKADEAPDPSQGELLYLALPRHAAGMPHSLVTDAAGTFRINGIGRDRRVQLQVSGDTIGFSRIAVLTRLVEPSVEISDQPNLKRYKKTTYGAHFDFIPPPGRVVSGVVRDASTNKPMPGVTVTSTWIEPMIWIDAEGLIQSVTDEQGRYRLPSIPKAKGNRIMAIAPPDQPYFMYELDVPEARDAVAGETQIDFAMDRGVWINGKVTDKLSGSGVPSRLFYAPFLDNPRAKNIPAFKKFGRGGTAGTMPGTQIRYATNGDGTFRIVGVPGPAIIGARADGELHYRLGGGADQIAVMQDRQQLFRKLYQPVPNPSIANVLKEIDVPDNEQGISVELQMDPGDSVWIAAQDPQGKPMTGVYADGVEPTRYANWGGRTDQRMENATFEAKAFSPDEARTMLLRDDDRKLGRAVIVRLSELPDLKLTVQLQPIGYVTGRLIDAAHNPLKGIRLQASTKTADSRELPQVFSDDQGWFSYPVLPGCGYAIGAFWNEKQSYVTVTSGVTVVAGATAELGDVVLRPQGSDR